MPWDEVQLKVGSPHKRGYEIMMALGRGRLVRLSTQKANSPLIFVILNVVSQVPFSIQITLQRQIYVCAIFAMRETLRKLLSL